MILFAVHHGQVEECQMEGVRHGQVESPEDLLAGTRAEGTNEVEKSIPKQERIGVGDPDAVLNK